MSQNNGFHVVFWPYVHNIHIPLAWSGTIFSPQPKRPVSFGWIRRRMQREPQTSAQNQLVRQMLHHNKTTVHVKCWSKPTGLPRTAWSHQTRPYQDKVHYIHRKFNHQVYNIYYISSVRVILGQLGSFMPSISNKNCAMRTPMFCYFLPRFYVFPPA